MLISKALNDAINAQIGHEFQASMEYIQMAVFFDAEGLKKLTSMFFKQAGEERDHAMKFIDYVMDTGGQVIIPALPAPKADYQSVEEVFQTALNWEMVVTDNIIKIRHIAEQEKDYAAQQFLDWYHKEQIEEVNTMETMLKVARKVGEKNVIMLEAYLSHKD